MTASPHRLHEVYIDETSQSGPRYLVIGGIVFPAKYSEAFEQAILDARHPTFPTHYKTGKHAGKPYELGWNEFTPNSRDEFKAYVRVVDAFFKFGTRMTETVFDAIRFHCAVVDTHVRGRRYSGKGGQIGFDREIYYHCLRLGRNTRWYEGCHFHVYPDERTTDQPPEKLAYILSRGVKKHMPIDQRWLPFRRVQFRKSHEWQALQVSDILIGAIAYRLNAYDKPEAHPNKKKLCEYILKKGAVWLQCVPGNPKFKDWGNFTMWVRKHRN